MLLACELSDELIPRFEMALSISGETKQQVLGAPAAHLLLRRIFQRGSAPQSPAAPDNPVPAAGQRG